MEHGFCRGELVRVIDFLGTPAAGLGFDRIEAKARSDDQASGGVGKARLRESRPESHYMKRAHWRYSGLPSTVIWASPNCSPTLPWPLAFLMRV